MSHLHIPDGVLPIWLWGTALAIALILLFVTSRRAGVEAPQAVAYRGALGALALAAMAVQIPLGVLDYHLTLVGPIGVLLGPAAAFQVVAVASAILAFVGHGGVTVVGLNALILGAGAAIARPVYEWTIRRRAPAASMAVATAAGQTLSGGLWFLVVMFALRSTAWKAGSGHDALRPALFTAIAIPMWLGGVIIESVVAFGLARFLARVRPDLLPAAGVAPVIGNDA